MIFFLLSTFVKELTFIIIRGIARIHTHIECFISDFQILRPIKIGMIYPVD